MPEAIDHLELTEAYRVLELQLGASADEVRHAYRAMVKRWHPDRFADAPASLQREADDQVRLINSAYETIRRSHESGLPLQTAANAPKPKTQQGGAVFDLRNAPHLQERAPVVEREPYYAPDKQPLFARQFSGGWGFVDQRGTTVVPGVWGVAQPFSEELAAVGSGRTASMAKYGYIDRRGDVIIPIQFDDARQFRDGRAPVRVHNLWGYIDRTGLFVVRPRFQVAHEFSEGFAAIREAGYWGYINTMGEYLARPQFTKAGPFVDGWAVVHMGHIEAKLTRAGQLFLFQR